MSNTLQIKRGLQVNLPTGLAGELLFTTDTKRLYISDGAATNLIQGASTLLTTGAVPFSDANGKITMDATKLYWDNTNKRLGIGTATPGYALDVNSTSRITQSNAGNTPNLILATPASNLNLKFFVDQIAAYDNATSSALYLNYNGGDIGLGGTKATLKYGTGNFLIGTTTDGGARLLVKGTGNTSATTSFLVQDSSGQNLVKINDNGAMSIGLNSSPSTTANSLVIGLTTTNDQLTITNSTFITSLSTMKLAVNGSTGTQININGLSDCVQVGNSGFGVNATPTSGVQRAVIKGWGSTSATTTMLLQNSSSTNLLIVRDDGNVGIGTASPSYLLDVNGTARISSTLVTGGGTPLSLTGESFAFQTVVSSGPGGSVFGTNASSPSFIDILSGSNFWHISNRSSIGSNRLGIYNASFVGSTATYSSELLTLTTSGNLGIGTTSPGALLHVNGNLIAGASTTSGMFFNTANDTLSITNQRVLEKSGSNILIGYTCDSLQFRTVSTERMRISSTGNVGIGTTAPSTILEANGIITSTRIGAASQYLQIDGGDAVGPYLTAAGAAKVLTIRNNSTTSSDIKFDQAVASPYMWLQAGTERMRIASTGNLLIGTTTDSGYKLDVNGTGRFQGTDLVLTGSNGGGNPVRISTTNTNSAGVADAFFFNSAGNYFGAQMYGTTATGTFANVTNANLAKFVTNASNFVIGTQGASPIIFAVNALAASGEVGRFSSTGNFGIGTTTPGRKLTVNGIIASQLSDANDIQGLLYANTTAVEIHATYGSTGSYVPMIFKTNNAERLRIDTAGNVGIGTTSPTGLLDINTGSVNITTYASGQDLKLSAAGFFARANRIYNTVTTSSTTFFGAYGASYSGVTRAYWTIGDQTTDSTGWTFSSGIHLISNGNVLINTTTDAGAKLFVRGSGTTGSTFPLLLQNSAGNELFKVQDDGIAYLGKASAYFRILQNGNDSYIQKSNYATGRMIFTGDSVSTITGGVLFDTTKFGINTGTTTATATLQVKGSGTTSATTSLLVQDSGSNVLLQVNDNYSMGMGTAPDSTAGRIKLGGNTSTSIILTGFYGQSEVTFGVGLILNNVSIQPTTFQLSGTEKMRITQGGNVMIGTTTDAGYKLEVYGGTSKFQSIIADGNIIFNAPYWLQWVGSNVMFADGTDTKIRTSGGGITQFITAGFQNQLILTSDKQAGVNTSAVDPSAQLQVDSTTRGFLPPRMLESDRLAIAAPALGLMVYQTDMTEGLYIYKSAGWVFVI